MSREDLHFRLRIPEELKRRIADAADANGRSMTAEIVSRLEQSFYKPVVLPEDLSERIRIYAERQSTSMNDEIVRVLEREWPQQWPLETRLQDLAETLSILAAGKSDPRIRQFLANFEDTIEGIVSGRVTGVDRETRESIMTLWQEFELRRGEEEMDAYKSEFDEEEDRSMQLIGRPEKYAVPPPDRKELWKLTEEEFDVYKQGYDAGLKARFEKQKREDDDESVF